MRGYTTSMRFNLTNILKQDLSSIFNCTVTSSYNAMGCYTELRINNTAVKIPDSIFCMSDYDDIRDNVIKEIKDKRRMYYVD